MKRIILLISLIVASGILTANIYNTVIDARSWASDLPNSIQAARQYFKSVNPGDFYRIISPISQLLALISIILFWKAGKKIRIALIVAFVLFFATDILTFTYFYPRNDIMFRNELDIEKIRIAWQEWTSMNWVRTFAFAIGIFCTAYSLDAIYTRKSVAKLSVGKLAA